MPDSHQLVEQSKVTLAEMKALEDRTRWLVWDVLYLRRYPMLSLEKAKNA